MVIRDPATMKFSFKSFIFYLALTGSFLVLCNPASCQPKSLNNKLSFSAKNVSVPEALEQLSHITGTTFSYNPDQLAPSRYVNVDIHNKTMSEILNAILGPSMFGYRQIGNQIIIYKLKEVEKPDHTPGEPEKAPVKLTPPNKPDTIYVTKSVTIHDTVRLTDTIKRVDTVVVKKESEAVPKGEIFKDHTILKAEMSKTLKFDIGVSANWMLPNTIYEASSEFNEKLTEYKKSFSDKSFSGSAGLDVRSSIGHWTISSGIAITSFGQKLNYAYSIQTGGYYQKDTLDSYYTLNGNDTAWSYLVDTNYIPIDNQLFEYRIGNHMRWLEVPLCIQYNYGVGSTLLFIKGGLIPGFFISSDGQSIRIDGDGTTSLSEMEINKVIFSYITSIGLAVPIGRKTTFIYSLFYRGQFGSIYKDFPIDTRVSAFGLNAGIVYKLY